MKRIFLSFLWVFVVFINANAQKKQQVEQPFERPKLVVGIVVDQMRNDYLFRFWDRYSDGGFKRIIGEGFTCKNNHFNYVPTYTGPGHSSVYAGTTPIVHGIIANNWYDKNLKKSVYCAQDDEVSSVGTTHKAGKMSPRRLKTTTIGDQLKLATQSRSKVIGVALKDRSSILPGGHTADAAYWFHGKNEGIWISSSYYMEKLPKWVDDFNQSRSIDQYKKPWTTLYDIATYTQSGSDINDFEGKFKGETNSGFPHELDKLWEANGGYDILRPTPYGSSLTTDFAIAALHGENLGGQKDTDLLAISYSSPDYTGHMYGVNSKEIEDTYLRLDLDLKRLLEALDKKLGKGNYTLFLTADHGAVDVPAYLQSLKIPAGYFDEDTFTKELKAYSQTKYGVDLIENVSNDQVFLNMSELDRLNLDIEKTERELARWILAYKDVAEVYVASDLHRNNYTHGMVNLIKNGHNQKRSGNIAVVLDNAVISYSRTGSTHGSGYTYDTQVPLLFYGKGIKKGSTARRTEIPDIAATLAAFLGIQQTSGNTGTPVNEALVK
ncbi:MAG: alkaline phosphatase family protein [Capnocytophaga sp.]|nr:alkaline phosphatase family protein [Capnocytophaga sp.]